MVAGSKRSFEYIVRIVFDRSVAPSGKADRRASEISTRMHAVERRQYAHTLILLAPPVIYSHLSAVKLRNDEAKSRGKSGLRMQRIRI
jgi:hypothetical protein